MKRRFAWIGSLPAVGFAGGALLLASLAGCEDVEFAEDRNDVPKMTAVEGELPPEFVELISQPKPTVVDFYATWCPPCQDQKPLFAEAERQYASTANFLVVDVDENPEIAMAYEVQEIPTLMIFKNGEPVERMLGVHSPEEIGEALTKLAE